MKNFNEFLNEELTKKQMKLPKALRDAIEKKEGKKPKKDKEDKEEVKGKKGEKKEKEEKIETKGLTKKQQKLPIGLQKAILKKQNKKK